MAKRHQQTGNLAKVNQSHKGASKPAQESPSPPATQNQPSKGGQRALSATPRRNFLEPIRKYSNFAGIGVSWGAVCLTLLSALFFLPRVSVDVPAPYDPANPTPISFTMSNTNIIALRDFQPSVGVCFLKVSALDGTEPNCNGPAGSKLRFMPWHADWLSPDEKYQIFLEQAITSATIPAHRTELNANITISVEFSPWYAPWRLTKEFRFVTKKLSDGKTYWIPTPLNK